MDSGAPLWYIEKAHVDGITALKLSHNMRFLLSGGEMGEVRLWELRSRELISHMKEHTQRITDIEIFADDTKALTSSKDKCIMLWSLKDEVEKQSNHVKYLPFMFEAKHFISI
jgi:WD40 repeat protein